MRARLARAAHGNAVCVCNFGADHSAKAHVLIGRAVGLVPAHGCGSPHTPAGWRHESRPPHLVPDLLLAAGRGERMRSLTDTAPKPLLQVQGQPLLQWHLAARQEAGDKWCSTLPGWERRSVTLF